MQDDIFFRAIKFMAVGFTGMLVDFGLTFLFKEKLKVNKFIANAIGFSVAVVNNYSLNRIWTFHSSDPHIIRQFSFFLTISLSGLVLNTAVLYLLTEKKKVGFLFEQTDRYRHCFLLELHGQLSFNLSSCRKISAFSKRSSY